MADVNETLIKFVNQLSDDLECTRVNAAEGFQVLSSEVAELKVWIRHTIQEELDAARRELRDSIAERMEQLTRKVNETHASAEKEVLELERMLATPTKRGAQDGSWREWRGAGRYGGGLSFRRGSGLRPV